MAVLLCSTLVYNSLGSIDENAIANLSFIAQLSKHIRISGDDESKNEAVEFHRCDEMVVSSVNIRSFVTERLSNGYYVIYVQILPFFCMGSA